VTNGDASRATASAAQGDAEDSSRPRP